MPTVSRPSSPDDELAARRNWSGPTLANGVLTADLAAFCQSGVSVVMATCGADGRPVVGRGLAVRIDRGGYARVLLRKASNAALLRALGDGAGLAVTFTQPSTHRSIQLKAGGANLYTIDALDGAAVAAQTAENLEALQRRLRERSSAIQIEKCGRFRLEVPGPLTLEEVDAGGL